MTREELAGMADRLIFFVRGLGVQSADARDVAQKAISQCLRSRRPVSEMNESYVIKVAQNVAYRRHKNLAREARHVKSIGRATTYTPAPEPSMRLSGGEDFRRIAEAMQLLPDNEADAVRTIVCSGMSYVQSAAALGVNVSTVNNWKHRGMVKLARLLDSTAA